MIDQSQVHGEVGTGYEGPQNGPFACHNCQYFKAGSCGQKIMMEKSKLPRVDGGRVKVDPKGCCEYIDRKKVKRMISPRAKAMFGKKPMPTNDNDADDKGKPAMSSKPPMPEPKRPGKRMFRKGAK